MPQRNYETIHYFSRLQHDLTSVMCALAQWAWWSSHVMLCTCTVQGWLGYPARGKKILRCLAVAEDIARTWCDITMTYIHAVWITSALFFISIGGKSCNSFILRNILSCFRKHVVIYIFNNKKVREIEKYLMLCGKKCFSNGFLD